MQFSGEIGPAYVDRRSGSSTTQPDKESRFLPRRVVSTSPKQNQSVDANVKESRAVTSNAGGASGAVARPAVFFGSGMGRNPLPQPTASARNAAIHG
jgi:hypothetical protein